MIPLVLTYVGDDRPGLVSAVSEKIAAFGGTWLESRSARLAGKFAGILRVNVPEANLPGLERALRDLAPAGLSLTIERGADEEPTPSARLITLDILGNERPGIVRDVAQALTALGVNIEEFESRLESAAFTGVEMFRARRQAPRPRDAAARGPAQDARAARRRDHGRSDPRRGGPAPLTRPLSRPPLWGRVGLVGRANPSIGRTLQLGLTDDRTQSLERPPSIILPHKGGGKRLHDLDTRRPCARPLRRLTGVAIRTPLEVRCRSGMATAVPRVRAATPAGSRRRARRI